MREGGPRIARYALHPGYGYSLLAVFVYNPL
jgi:hypothetical protein